MYEKKILTSRSKWNFGINRYDTTISIEFQEKFFLEELYDSLQIFEKDQEVENVETNDFPFDILCILAIKILKRL